jgi:hypothetical protein
MNPRGIGWRVTVTPDVLPADRIQEPTDQARAKTAWMMSALFILVAPQPIRRTQIFCLKT